MKLVEVVLCDGKYTVIQDQEKGLYALRYGEPWRDLVGDNLILYMAYEIDDLRKEVDRLRKGLKQ